MAYGNNSSTNGVASHPASSLQGRNLISIADLSLNELNNLIYNSMQLKASYRPKTRSTHVEARNVAQPLIGTTMAMIFQKRSTRTRVSTETGMSMLGGHALFLGPTDIQLGVNETVKDTALVLSRFNDILLARVNDHEDILTLAREASVPVINALSSLHHPLQALADVMTLQEHFGAQGLHGRTLAWVGDGNNVLHDLALAAAISGMNLQIACPQRYQPDAGVLKQVQSICQREGAQLTVGGDPNAAVRGADVVVTDTWISMGQESEREVRLKEFEGYQVTEKLMSLAKPEAVFMHCLPRHAEEVDDEVFYSKKSLVFDEAENRMWTVMALTLALLGK